jgi:histidinol-phosphate aminotransferase
VVVDEAFMEFSPGEPESLAGRGDLPGLVVVRSLTKLWSLPGIRAGYLLGPPDLVARLRETRQPWGVNTLALRALEAWAADPGGARGRAEEVAARREELAMGLAALPGVRVWPSAANFLLIEVEDGARVRRALRDRGIAVRRADTFPGLGPNHLRVAVRSAEDNRALVGALREVLPR